jgi:hypothetical protein
MNVIQKPLSGIKNVLQKPHEAFQELLDFAIHRRQNETRSRKITRVKTVYVYSAVSRGTLMQ